MITMMVMMIITMMALEYFHCHLTHIVTLRLEYSEIANLSEFRFHLEGFITLLIVMPGLMVVWMILIKAIV